MESNRSRQGNGSDADTAEGVFVEGYTEDGFLCRIRSGNHELMADEPESAGGTDIGPGPYELLAAALGACTVMTLNMYARRKQLPVTNVSCRVRHKKTHARDCADCETKEGRIDELFREIRIQGTLDQARIERMMEIADRCPVHRTLSGEIRIRSSLVE